MRLHPKPFSKIKELNLLSVISKNKTIKSNFVKLTSKIDQLLGRDHRQRLQIENNLRLLNESLEAKVAERTRDFSTLAENIPQLIWVLDGTGKAVYYNRHWQNYTGMTIDVTSTWEESIHHDDIIFAKPEWEKSLRTGEPYSVEFRLKRVDGVYRWHLVRGFPMKDDQGRVIKWFGTSTDIQEQKEAYRRLMESEAQTRASEERFRATFSQAAVGMGQVGLAGQWLLVNQRFCEIVGRSSDELVNQNFHDVIFSEDRIKSEGLWENLREGKISAFNNEKRYLRKDQSIVWVNLTASVVKDLSGKPKYFITVIEDISEKVRAREAIERINENLEQRVALRTRELVASQKMLAEKNLELLKSNEDLEDFAHIASHDLKEPLRGIHNYSTFLLEDYADILDSVGKDKLNTLKKLAERMDVLIDSLLYYSKVGLSDLAVKNTDLNGVVEEVLGFLKASIETESVQIELKNKLPTLKCDSVRVSEIFLNLISNSIKYNDKEHKKIMISSTLEKDGCYLFSVEDNGIGISPEHHALVFRMFRRLHSKGRFGSGTGVGLTVVKKIVDRHGGVISMKSIPGQGTTFQFTLGNAPHTQDQVS